MGSSLKDKVAIVTGGGRGIGRATAELLAAAGAKVIVTSRTESELRSVESKGISSFAADVSSEKNVLSLFDTVEKIHGRIDILINNAGTILVKKIEEMTAADCDQMLSVNLRGVFLCSREAFRRMKSGGSIVNVASIAGLRGVEKFEGFSVYTATKFGVIGMTECLAVEGAKKNIRVNCVAPGAVDTRMLKEAAPFLQTKTKPEDIAKMILFLANESESGRLNGSTIEAFTSE